MTAMTVSPSATWMRLSVRCVTGLSLPSRAVPIQCGCLQTTRANGVALPIARAASTTAASQYDTRNLRAAAEAASMSGTVVY